MIKTEQGFVEPSRSSVEKRSWNCHDRLSGLLYVNRYGNETRYRGNRSWNGSTDAGVVFIEALERIVSGERDGNRVS